MRTRKTVLSLFVFAASVAAALFILSSFARYCDTYAGQTGIPSDCRLFYFEPPLAGSFIQLGAVFVIIIPLALSYAAWRWSSRPKESIE